VVVVGVCANATVANNAEPAKPAATDFANMMCLPDMKWSGENNLTRRPFRPTKPILGTAAHYLFKVPRNIRTCGAGPAAA
jgi:hypothetical protein